MNVFKYAASFVRWTLVELAKDGIAKVIALAVFAPICLVTIWLTLSHLARGSDVLSWLVTGLLVLLALPVVYFINKVHTRIDAVVSDGQDKADDGCG